MTTTTTNAIVLYDEPIHMTPAIKLVSDASEKVQTCEFCNSRTTKFFQVCKAGCLSCDKCDEVLGVEYYFNESKRGKKCRQCKGLCLDEPIFNRAYTDLGKKVVEMNIELKHGINQLKNHGYVTHDMSLGGPTPDWVPIPRDKAVKEALEFLKTDPNLAMKQKKRKAGEPQLEDFANEEEFDKETLWSHKSFFSTKKV